MQNEVREAIENIIGQYCDGTLTFSDGVPVGSLRYSYFVEDFERVDGKSAPQCCADQIVDWITEHCKK